jgi:pyrroline-5-carboxylate reductase
LTIKGLAVYSRENNVHAIQQADIIILAVKPKYIERILKADGVREALAGKLVISIISQTSVARLEALIDEDKPRECKMKPIYIKRAMLNTAADFGKAMVAREARSTLLPAGLEYTAEWVILCVGKFVQVAPEEFEISGVMVEAALAFLSVAFNGSWMVL